MDVNGLGTSYAQAGGMMGVGMKTLQMAQQAPAEMAKRLLPMQAAGNAARAATEAKGLMVDTYA